MKKAISKSNLSEVDKMINKVLDTASDEREFNFRYLYILMMIAKIKGDPDIDIYRVHDNGKDIFTVISSEIETYQETTVNGKIYTRKV